MESARVAIVREAYERFNNADVGGLVDLLDPDVEIPDVLNGSVFHGKEAIRRYWERQFELVDSSLLVREIVEIGDAVLVVVFQEVHDRDSGAPLGQGVVAVHRLTFRGNHISAIEYTGVDEVPELLRQRLA